MSEPVSHLADPIRTGSVDDLHANRALALPDRWPNNGHLLCGLHHKRHGEFDPIVFGHVPLRRLTVVMAQPGLRLHSKLHLRVINNGPLVVGFRTLLRTAGQKCSP